MLSLSVHEHMKKLLIFVLLVMPLILTAQTFRAGALVGLNASQIDGDLLAGFDKLGLNLGGEVRFSITNRLLGKVELLWSQQGSTDEPFSGRAQRIHLNYVAIPFGVAYEDWLKDEYYKVNFESGFVYSRLLDASISILGLEQQTELLNNDGISFYLGAMFFARENRAFSFRYTRAITNLLSRENAGGPPLREYYLSFRYHVYF